MSILSGVLAVTAYSKWCNNNVTNQERIIDNEINNLDETCDQLQFN